MAEPLVLGKLSLETELHPWIRPASFVSEYTPLSELLPMMQRNQQAMVMVVDEFGGTVGLVAIQDLIAEIIGNTGESESTDELMIQSLDEQTFLVQAQMNLEDLNELLELNLPLTNEYQTLGWFLTLPSTKNPASRRNLALSES